MPARGDAGRRRGWGPGFRVGEDPLLSGPPPTFLPGWWFYFLGKAYLAWKGLLHLDPWWNLAFLIWIKARIPGDLWWRGRGRWVRPLLQIPVAVVLFWHDSWMPPWRTVVAFLQEPLPQGGYWIQFFSGVLDFWDLLALGGILGMCYAVRGWLTLTPVVVILLLAFWIQDITQARDPVDQKMAAFYTAEAERRLAFPVPASREPSFDILLLHICSLGWDDLQAVGLEDHPLLQSMQLLLTRFNSVTSYSNPAAHRLLRAPCGQVPHRALYTPVSEECSLLEGLRRIGFQSFSAFNHDGVYGGFREELIRLDRLDPPIPVADLPVVAENFDGTPLHDDAAVLHRLWQTRLASGASRAILYYNTLSLHDGAHRREPGWWKRDRKQRYREFVLDLFADLEAFFEDLETSGRRVLVVLIPEHGMALRGSRLQPPGLRDIPLPRITWIPVGIRWVGPEEGSRISESEFHVPWPIEVGKPTSYLALARVLQAFLEPGANPQDPTWWQRLSRTLPETPFLAENEHRRVVQVDGRFYVERPGASPRWVLLPEEEIPWSRREALVSEE